MKRRALFASIIAVLSASLVTTPMYATTPADQQNTETPAQSYIPITFEPACTTRESLALWNITNNQNTDPVSLTYTNIDTGVSETFDIQPSTNTFLTKVAADVNNTTSFTLRYSGQEVGRSQTNAQSAPCATPVTPVTPAPACETVDKYNRDRLQYQRLSENSYSVSITQGKPLCDDVDFYLSSYELPATYDKSGEFNQSASPQAHYESDTVNAAAGSTGLAPTVLNVGVPTSCNSYQVDLYFGPQVTTVTYENQGHGEQNIEGIIYNAGADCGQTTNPGQGGGETPPATPPMTQPEAPAPGTGQTPEAPAEKTVVAPATAPAPAKAAAAPVTTPAEIPSTGPASAGPLGTIITVLAMATAYGAAYGLQRRQSIRA